MSYFLTDQKLSENSQIELSGEEARHILLARRMKKGESFNLQGKNEERYEAEIIEIGRNLLKLKCRQKIKTPLEPKVKITLLQSHVNEKALDFILQKSAELGAHKIVLFNSQNTATKLTSDAFKKKSGRWNKILWEAAKQSDRVRPPQLEFLKGLDDVTLSANNYQQIFLCDINGTSPKSAIANLKSKIDRVALLIGPEGGFAQEEITKIKSLPNCQSITLGSILLRAETAALASLAIVSTSLE